MPHADTTTPHRSVLTIGSFDGVHAGHQALIHRARAMVDSYSKGSGAARQSVRVIAQVFDPSPVSVLRPHDAPSRISTFDQRRQWLLAAGADEVLKLEPTRQLLSLSAADFVAQKVQRHRPVAWVEGPDFRFGQGRQGDDATLARLGKQHGFEVSIVEPVTVTLDDHSIVPARSTMTRWLLAHARVRDAAHVLTRPHQLVGTVVPGDRRGRAIGFPTANLDTPCLVPADGVYAGIATLPDSTRSAAAISIGNKPTFGPQPRSTVEAFIMDPEATGRPWAQLAGLPEYGWELRIDLVGFVRDQYAFPDVSALLEQIERDCDRIAEIVAQVLTPPHRSLRAPQEAGA